MSRSTMLLFGIVLLLSTACWSTPTDKSALRGPERERISIGFAVPDWELEQNQLYHLVEQFEAQHPDIHIEVKPFSQILGLSSMAEFQVTDDLWFKLASGADVFRVMFTNGIDRQPIIAGLVRDLRPFIESDTAFEPDDFYAGALDAAAWREGVWAIPTALDYELVMFDREAFDEAGIPYPEPGWTWDDLATRARALTLRSGNGVSRWGFAQTSLGPVEVIEQRAAPLLDDTAQPPIPRFTEPQVMQVAQWLVNLVYYDQAMVVEPVAQGGAAMWSNAAWQARARPRNVGVAPYPVDTPDSKTTPMYLDQIVMSAGTPHPDAAWCWMDFLSRQLPGRPGWLPARRSVAEATGFWNGLDEELKSALYFAREHAVRLSLRDWDVAYEPLDTELWATIRGEKTVADALAAAQSKAKAGLAVEFSRQAVTPMSTTAPNVGESAVTITFAPYGTTALQSWHDAARRFHTIYPNITVAIMPAPLSGDITSIAEHADCFQAVPHLDAPGTVAAIHSLDHLLDSDPGLSSDLFPSLLALYRRQGQLWGVPAEAQPYVIEYSRALFDIAGRAYPEPDWTIDDFLILARGLTQERDGGKQYGFVSNSELLDLLLFVERLGGQIVDEAQDPPIAAFENPATVAAIRWYADLYLTYEIKPSCVADNTDCEALIEAGRAAMWGRPFQHGESALNILPFPQGPGGKGMPILYTTGYFISAGTTAPEGCWEWIKFLTAETSVIQGLPARRSITTSEAYRPFGSGFIAAYLSAIEGNQGPSDLQYLTGRDWSSPYLVFLERAYRRIVEEGESPERALVAAQRLADEYRACVIARAGFFDREKWEGCLREVDSTLPDPLFTPAD